MKKQIPKPEYWQDFEDLCKILWGEIWSIPLKIKKNGRVGQLQNGVDIYGIPKGENQYWGIQCKGKDEYSNARLTKKDIDNEIKNAKNFKPKLRSFIIATTANKDTVIEEYVRVLNISQIESGEFEIELFCWEDIVDELLKHKNVLHQYLNSIHYKADFDFQISVNGSENNLVPLNPLYYKGLIEDKVQRKTSMRVPWTEDRYGISLLFDGSSQKIQKQDLSCCLLTFHFENTGSKVIEDWKLMVDFENKFKYLDIINSEESMTLHYHMKSELEINKNIVTFCDNKPFIQEDNRQFSIWLTPEREDYKIDLTWKLLARDYSKSGTITLTIKPIYEEKNLINQVDSFYHIQEPREYVKPYIKYL